MSTDAVRRHLLEGEREGARFAFVATHRPPFGLAGLRLGARSGSSLEFQDHREYQPGDDLRFVDWGAYARSDKLVVKRYHEEVFPHVDLVLDGSRSMDLEGGEKGRAAVALSALVAAAAANADLTVTCWLAVDGCEKVIGGGLAPSAWEGIRLTGSRSPAAAFAAAPPALKPQGIRVFVSDLLFEDDPEPILALLSRNAAAVVVVQLLGAADADPGERGSVRLVDVESGAISEVRVDDASLRRYRDALKTHEESWTRAARRAGAALVTLVAEDVVKGWALEELVAAGLLQPV